MGQGVFKPVECLENCKPSNLPKHKVCLSEKLGTTLKIAEGQYWVLLPGPGQWATGTRVQTNDEIRELVSQQPRDELTDWLPDDWLTRGWWRGARCWGIVPVLGVTKPLSSLVNTLDQGNGCMEVRQWDRCEAVGPFALSEEQNRGFFVFCFFPLNAVMVWRGWVNWRREETGLGEILYLPRLWTQRTRTEWC